MATRPQPPEGTFAGVVAQPRGGAAAHVPAPDIPDHDLADRDTGNHDTADHDAADHDTADHDAADHDTADHDTADHDAADHDAADHDTADAGDLNALVRSRRILVMCGAGGVGKTTTAAALALSGAAAGRRVLVLTIDPARRLAEALGIPAHAPQPVTVPAERLAAAGMTGAGTLDAWMLDPRVILEDMIRRLAPDRAEQLFANRLYRPLLDLVAGVHEYMATEALYDFVGRGYDLIVLDTPPSRNALEFLDAPGRVLRFLDEGILQLFLPRDGGGGGGILRRAGRFVGGVFARVFGESFLDDLTAFMALGSGMVGALRAHNEAVRAMLAAPESAFLLVTSPEEEALREALYFRNEIAARGLPFAGFVLNRSLARLDALTEPHDWNSRRSVPPSARAALDKLALLAGREREQARADSALLGRLKGMAGAGRVAVAAPHLGDAVEDLPGLLLLARGMSV